MFILTKKNFLFITMIYQLCAYKKTGKDTLVNYVIENRLKELEWKVYSAPTNTKKLKLKNKNVVRLSYAYDLKKEVCELFNLPIEIIDNGELDKIKDTQLFKHPHTHIEGTLRDFLIEIGTDKKKKYGKTYYSDIVNKQIIHKTNNYYITDVRFKIELIDDAVKIKLFRKEVPIPDMTIESEHQLDDITFDYLLLKDEADLKVLSKLQPQYKDYRFLHNLE